MSDRKDQQTTEVKRQKNDFCRKCVHWKWHEQFCEKTQQHPQDIIVCSMRKVHSSEQTPKVNESE